MSRPSDKSNPKPSRRSVVALNAVNFFLAEMAGVIGPFLAVFLKEKEWTYSQIGMATAIGGLGTLIFQTPAGYICDYFKNRKRLLGAMSLLLGLCFGVLPFAAKNVWWVDILLFTTGAASAFFVPLLATLALSLVGPKKFAHITGQNQSYNHVGNITAALLALIIVKALGVEAIFFIMASVSLLAVGALLFIRTDELDPNIGCEAAPIKGSTNIFKSFREILEEPQARILLLSVMLFHIANAPVLPLVGLYIKHLGGEDSKVAWTVLIAQAVMVPVALLAGKYCENMGRKPVFAFAFIILPVRILLYTTTTNPTALLAIQALDGIGAGIYGVVIALICSDLTRGKGGFNMLMGVAQTALAFGGFLGPLGQGLITEALGFRFTFLILAMIATAGGVIFITFMKETRESPA
jgi:MFS family permease